MDAVNPSLYRHMFYGFFIDICFMVFFIDNVLFLTAYICVVLFLPLFERLITKKR